VAATVSEAGFCLGEILVRSTAELLAFANYARAVELLIESLNEEPLYRLGGSDDDAVPGIDNTLDVWAASSMDESGEIVDIEIEELVQPPISRALPHLARLLEDMQEELDRGLDSDNEAGEIIAKPGAAEALGVWADTYLTRPAYGTCDVVRTFTKTVRVTESGWEEIDDTNTWTTRGT
jgi:hypothetical protein